MRLITQVRFEEPERKAIRDALTHIRIAYPDYDERDSRGKRVSKARVLGHLADGLPTDRLQLERSVEVLTNLRDRCREEAQAVHWQQFRDNSAPAATEGPPSALGLIADPDVMVETLAQARALQADQADEALAVVRRALSFMPVDSG